MHVHRQHQAHADIQHEHRTAARRVKRQGHADDRQQPQVHPHVDGDLGQQRAAHPRTDEAAQHILAAAAHRKGADDQGDQHPQHHHAAHKAQGVAHPAEDEVVVGVGHAVVFPAEHPVAEDASRAQGHLAPVLLVDDVAPHIFAGGPAGGVLGVDDRQDAVPLIALADAVAQEQEGRRHRRNGRRQGRHDILPAQPGGEHHAAANDAVDDGGAVVALDVDQQDRRHQVRQQLGQLPGLVDPAADIVQVHGKGQDKADLGQLGGLEGEASQPVPGIVVGVAGVVADGQRPQSQVVDEQGGQHQPPGERHMEGPHLDQAAVVHRGQQQGDEHPRPRGSRLDQRPAVIPDAGDLAGDLVHRKAAALLRCPGGQHQHGHGAAEQAQQQIDLVGPFRIHSNGFEHKSTTFLVRTPGRAPGARSGFPSRPAPKGPRKRPARRRPQAPESRDVFHGLSIPHFAPRCKPRGGPNL